MSLTCALCVAAIFFGMALVNQTIIEQEMLSRARDDFAALGRMRTWNADFGGVYVEKKLGVESNRYLKNPDLLAADGRLFTLKNPALMTREISELSSKAGTLAFHFTSLNPLNPHNLPDDAERRALLSFEQGEREASWVERTTTGPPYFRYMAPLKVENSCLECHAEQGYRTGDVRGGISERYDMTAVERQLRRSTMIIVGLALVTVALLVLLVSVQIRRLFRQLANARRQLELLATTDALTGIWNRRYVMGRFAEELARQRRSQDPLSCAIVDVDHFKRVNDTWGHGTGDIVLKQVAAALQSAIRRYDVVGRYGGEEFFAILPGAGALAAGTVCERLRQSVQERVRAGDADGWPVTVSIGYTQLTAEDTAETALHRVDQALYRAKELGRNRCEPGEVG